jgi:hypothetical protein
MMACAVLAGKGHRATASQHRTRNECAHGWPATAAALCDRRRRGRESVAVGFGGVGDGLPPTDVGGYVTGGSGIGWVRRWHFAAGQVAVSVHGRATGLLSTDSAESAVGSGSARCHPTGVIFVMSPREECHVYGVTFVTGATGGGLR